MRAQLQLENYLVEELTLRHSPSSAVKPSQGMRDTVGVRFTVNRHKSFMDLFRIPMTITINPQKATNSSTADFRITMRLVGFYRFDPGVDEDTKNKMIYNNGSSILYGVARGIIAQLTGGLGSRKIILPSINLLETIAKQQGKKSRSIRKVQPGELVEN